MSNPVLATSDRLEELLQSWLYGRSPHTIASYRNHVQRFLEYVDKPLDAVTLQDVQGWQSSLGNLAPSSQATALAVIKSLFSFGYKTGFLSVNITKLAAFPKVRNLLSEKILTKEEVKLIMENEKNNRNRAILMTLYGCGLRVSELCELRWRDLRKDGNQITMTIFGKGGKTRSLLVPHSVWQMLISLGPDRPLDDPVFTSRQTHNNGDRTLSRKRVHGIVRQAAQRVGIPGKVSPHWFRHSHASHSLDRGAPLSLVQQTLGHASISTTEKYLHAKPNDSSGMYLDF